MRNVDCPICGPDVEFKIIYQENLPASKELVDFSARKTPDNFYFKMVRCKVCRLLYAKSIYDSEDIINLYEDSDFEYDEELENLKETYGQYLKLVDGVVKNKNSFLEIGCGNGFMLEKALELGYTDVVGFEPSEIALAKASDKVKSYIIKDVFNVEKLNGKKFDVIFFAMVIEHVDDVNSFLMGLYSVLNEGGMIIGVTHDERSLLSKILKDRCPIINDEHVYVFGSNTLQKIFQKNNFKVLNVDCVANAYSLKYWINMSPVPKVIKNVVVNFLTKLKLDQKSLKIRAGNIYIMAMKENRVQNESENKKVCDDLEVKAKELRRLIIDVSYKAGAHHIGSCLSCVDIVTALYFYKMNINPMSPLDPNRDWFILSKGHAAQVQYVALAKRGFFPENTLNSFLRDGSKLGTHPDKGCVPGVEVSTGSLGNGFSIGAGVALSAKKDKKDNKVYVVLGDGECNEGMVWETIMFASHQKLDNLVAIIDYNKLQGFGSTEEVMDLGSIAEKFSAFGWNAIEIDGHNMVEIVSALDSITFDSGRPTVIVANTIKGKGIFDLEGKLESHYVTLDEDSYNKAISEI
ncbi:MAG: methyltransferase domain-containing protein [bacterium]|nr:methyltransferase domain-containing protein [bacterium]